MLLAALGIGCSTSIEVHTSHHPSADFSNRTSYAWLPRSPTGDPRLDDEALDERVRTAVEAELAAKGLTKTAESPQLLLAHQVVLRSETRVSRFDDPDSVWDKDYVPRIDPSSDEAEFERDYDVGILVLEFSNPETKVVLWRGSANTEADLRDPSRKRDRIVQEAVRAMLAGFPPR